MAQAIHCDGEGHREALADVLVSRLENGETSAWCFDHYVDVCRAVVETVEAAERELVDREANARLETAAAARRAKDEAGSLGDVARDGSPIEAPDPGVASFREAGDESVPASVGGPETGETAQAGPEPAPIVSGSPGPSDGVQGDPGGAEPTP